MKNLLAFLLGVAVAAGLLVLLEFRDEIFSVSREVAVESIQSVDPRAIVALEFIEQKPGAGFSIRWPAVAFAIGDGTLLLTAAHCLGDIEERAHSIDSTDIVAISPYYGDVFAVERVAIDRRADFAILRASWPTHPALALASTEDLADATEMLIVSRPQAGQINTEIRTERLPILRSTGAAANEAIQLEGTRQVAGGWSGSPLLLPDTGAVAGITTQLRTRQFRRFRFWPTTLQDVLGCAVDSVHARLHELGLEAAALRPPEALEPIPDADHGFRLAMASFAALHAGKWDGAMESARELAGLRADSVQAHLLAAFAAVAGAGEPNALSPQVLEQAQASYLKAIEADPNDAHAYAIYGNFLAARGQGPESLVQAEKALAIDPNDRLAQVNRLRLLPFAQARQAAEQFIERNPGDPYSWFYYGNALVHLQEPELALEAVQRAVDLDPDGLFDGVKGAALAALGRLDEAEDCYRLMAERCCCQRCWYRYAAFIVDHRPDKLDEAQRALDLAESRSQTHRVSPQEMNDLRFRLLEKLSPQQAEAFALEKLDAAPDNARTWWQLAAILRTQERYDEAAEAARRAVDLDPNSSYQPRLANCLAKAGDLTAAQRVYDEMLERYPQRPRYWYWYAQFLADYHPDRLDEAIAALEKGASVSQADGAWSVPVTELAGLQERLSAPLAPVR